MNNLLPGAGKGHHDAQLRTGSGETDAIVARGGPDRIPCMIPTCSCSAAKRRFPNPETTDWICGKHWRALPPEFKRRWKQLNARSRKLRRLGNKSSYQTADRQRQWIRLGNVHGRAWQALDLAIIHYFTASDRPIGIEDFLKEHGIV